MTRPALLTFVGLFVLAPILAFVIIVVLLVAGVEPHLVFLPGHFIRERLHAPNAAGVLATGVVYWVVVAALWLLLRRAFRRPTA